VVKIQVLLGYDTM